MIKLIGAFVPNWRRQCFAWCCVLMRDCDCGAVKREKSWYCFTLNFDVLALYLLYFIAFHPAPPGLLAHPRSCLVGLRRPLLSREPLVVESRARRHSKALHKTHPKHLSELKVEVTFEVNVGSKLKIRRFDVSGPVTGIIDSHGSNSVKMFSYA